MKDWLIDNQMNVFGFICIITALFQSGTTAAVYGVGALLCWGIQEMLDQMRSEGESNV